MTFNDNMTFLFNNDGRQNRILVQPVFNSTANIRIGCWVLHLAVVDNKCQGRPRRILRGQQNGLNTHVMYFRRWLEVIAVSTGRIAQRVVKQQGWT